MKAIRKVASTQNLESFAPSFWVGDDDYEPGDSSADEMTVDMVHDIPPLVESMMSDLWRTRVITTVDRKVLRHVAGADDTVWDHENERACLTGITFSLKPEAYRPAGGLLMSFTSEDGRVKQPDYIARQPRGKYDKPRTDSGLRSYLALHGFKGERTYITEPQNLPAMFDPTPRVLEAQQLLEQAKANTKIMPPVIRCPTGVATGAIFLGGVKKPKTSNLPDLWGATNPILRHFRKPPAVWSRRSVAEAISNHWACLSAIRKIMPIGPHGEF